MLVWSVIFNDPNLKPLYFLLTFKDVTFFCKNPCKLFSIYTYAYIKIYIG